MNGKKRILFIGGGSGGHLYPILALCQYGLLMKKDLTWSFYYAGPELNKDLKNDFEKNKIKIKKVLGSKFTLYDKLRLPFELLKFVGSFFQAFFVVFSIMPEVIVSKGGPSTIPLLFWGRFMGIRIIVHESDMTIGRGTRWGVNFFGEFLSNFTELSMKRWWGIFGKKKSFIVGLPVRVGILDLKDKINDKKEIISYKLKWGIDCNKKTLFIFGGSLGSRVLAEFVINNLNNFLDNGVNIILQVGSVNVGYFKEKIKKEGGIYEKKENFVMREFINEKEMAECYLMSDVVMMRSGSSVCEVVAYKKNMIFVPLPIAAFNHQYKNAKFLEDKNLGVVLNERNLNWQNFWIIFQELNNKNNKSDFEKMSYLYEGSRKVWEIIED